MLLLIRILDYLSGYPVKFIHRYYQRFYVCLFVFLVSSTADCWGGPRAPNGTYTWDTDRFPSGIPALVDYLKARGFTFGAFSRGLVYVSVVLNL